MNTAGLYIEKVPEDHKMDKVSHRALTHSLWFSISFGFFVAVLTATGILLTMAVDLYFDTGIYLYVSGAMSVSPIYLIPLVFVSGFLSVCFHAVGDVFTPTGVHFLTPRTDYGYTFDLFYAKNEVANRSALPLGTIMISYSMFFGYYFGSISIIYLIGGFICLFVVLVPLWILFIKTPVGKWFYVVYDHLK